MQDVSKADVLQARIEANTARMLAENAKNEQLSAWRSLAAVVGQPEMSPIPLTGDLHAGLPTIEWNDALQNLLGGSPEVAGARTGVERAKWALSRAGGTHSKRKPTSHRTARQCNA